MSVTLLESPAPLVLANRANRDIIIYRSKIHPNAAPIVTQVPLGQGEPACRCFCCGTLLGVSTVRVNRDLGHDRPACEDHA